MPRAKQAKTAEAKKRAASTKNLSDEELSPKKAKTLRDSNKTGILDKCVFCTKSGVRTMLEGAGTATNMRFSFTYVCNKCFPMLFYLNGLQKVPPSS